MDWSRYLYYYRVSTNTQSEDGHALERYRDRAIALGIPEGNLYFDVESGRSAERKGLKDLCDRLATERKLRGLVVPEHSRLHRNEKVWLTVKELLIEHGLDYIDLAKGQDPIDLTSVEGEFGAGLDALLAQRYSRLVQTRSRDGHRNRRQKGRGQIPPFGYTRSHYGQFIPRVEEYRPGISWWQAARSHVEWMLKGKNYHEICRKSAAEWGPRTEHRDRPITPSGFRNWITHPALRGHMVYFRGNRGGQEQIAYNTHEALILPTEWHQIQPRLNNPATPKGEPHRLAKIVRCCECKNLMVRRNTPRAGEAREWLHCPHSREQAGKPPTCTQKKWLNYNLVEAKVIEALTTEAQKIAEILSEPDSPSDPNAIAITQLRNEIDQLTALKISGTESLIEEKKRAIAALKESTSSDRPLIDSEDLLERQAAASDPLFWGIATMSDRAAMYRALIDTVWVGATGVESIDFAFK
jgi:DNA invertase Pin-like site-specific DNA recombinase